MTKKGRQKFWRMKNREISGKRPNWGNFPRSPINFSEKGNLKQGENESLPQGMDAPAPCYPQPKIWGSRPPTPRIDAYGLLWRPFIPKYSDSARRTWVGTVIELAVPLD